MEKKILGTSGVETEENTSRRSQKVSFNLRQSCKKKKINNIRTNRVKLINGDEYTARIAVEKNTHQLDLHSHHNKSGAQSYRSSPDAQGPNGTKRRTKKKDPFNVVDGHVQP